MTDVLGVDGYVAGWVAVRLHDGAFTDCEIHASFAGVCKADPSASVIAVDIPIGLPDGEPRRADIEARKVLRGRASSIFTTPPRAVLEAATYAEALELSRRTTRRGISSQSFALAQKIIEANEITAADPRVREVHPEISFAEMHGEPVPHRKKSWSGAMVRRRLLSEVGIDVPDDLGIAGAAPIDDILDAAAAAWTATRIAAGTARSLPDPPERNALGIEMAIWL